LTEVPDGLEIAIGGEDFSHRFEQVHACLAIQLDTSGLAPTVDESKRHARALAVQDGLVNGHTSLLVLVRDDEVEVLDVVLLSS